MDNQECYSNLAKLVSKLKNSEDPKRKYEFILWLGKKLKDPEGDIIVPENKKGCCCTNAIFFLMSFVFINL